MLKLEVKIQLGHYQNHRGITCTKITVLALDNIKLTRHTKVLLQKHQVINLEAIKEIMYLNQMLQDQVLMIKT